MQDSFLLLWGLLHRGNVTAAQCSTAGLQLQARPAAAAAALQQRTAGQHTADNVVVTLACRAWCCNKRCIQQQHCHPRCDCLLRYLCTPCCRCMHRLTQHKLTKSCNACNTSSSRAASRWNTTAAEEAAACKWAEAVATLCYPTTSAIWL